MKKINVLVLGVGGVVSQGIVKALRNSNLNIQLIGACISEKSAGLYLCDKAYIAPYANDTKFMPWLIDLCNNEQIEIVLTGVEENIVAIAEHIESFREDTDAIFISSGREQLKIGQDKYLTCKWLEENGCNFPDYVLASDLDEAFLEKTKYPIVAKPRSGKGSSGVFLIRDEKDLDKLEQIEDKSSYVLEKCIGTIETEYTVGCYCDKQGVLKDIIIMHRDLQQGSTGIAEVVDNQKIEAEVRKICAKFKPSGPLNIQLRLDENGDPVCFELNIRFSGTTPMRAGFGYRDVEAMVKEYILNENIDECFQVKKGRAYRYVNEFYVFGDMNHIDCQKELIGQIAGKEIHIEKQGF